MGSRRFRARAAAGAEHRGRDIRVQGVDHQVADAILLMFELQLMCFLSPPLPPTVSARSLAPMSLGRAVQGPDSTSLECRSPHFKSSKCGIPYFRNSIFQIFVPCKSDKNTGVFVVLKCGIPYFYVIVNDCSMICKSLNNHCQ